MPHTIYLIKRAIHKSWLSDAWRQLLDIFIVVINQKWMAWQSNNSHYVAVKNYIHCIAPWFNARSSDKELHNLS
jgi:hypothetical protein